MPTPLWLTASAAASSPCTLPLVKFLARRYASHGEQFDDLVQVGAIGLIKAINRFDLAGMS